MKFTPSPSLTSRSILLNLLESGTEATHQRLVVGIICVVEFTQTAMVGL